MKIEFRPGCAYDGHVCGVRFTARVDDQWRRCLISDEALNDHFSGDDAKTGASRELLFESIRTEIEGLARKMIESGAQTDILIGTEDI